MKTTLKATLVATAIATLPLGSFAAGLGGLNVLSGLGQPLRAEIEVQATPDELRTLTARVASPDAFVRANVSYAPIMSALSFTIETRGNRSVVRVTSDRPVDEPFLEMLVELNWAEGRLLRQYTFLLDPVDLARPPVAAATIERPVAPPAAVAPRPAPAPAPAAVARVGGGQYQVARGDTLHRIATRNRPANTTVEQMMIALLRQNPAAFMDGNINRLRAGAILTIPDSDAVQSIPAVDARREVVAQSTDFEAYRRGLATAVATRPAAPAPAETREQVGQIVPRVAEPDVSALPRDRVEVSGAVAEGEDPDRIARLAALEEELTARERSLDEAYARLSELEQSIRDLQGLIELRNTALAQMQQQLSAAGLAPPEALPIEAPPDTSVEAGEADLADLPDLEALLSDAELAEETPAEVADAPAPVVEPPVAVAPTETIEERPAPRPAPEPIAPQPTFLQTILEDPAMLAAGGGVLILLLGYAGYRVRQKRKVEEPTEPAAALSEAPSSGHSVFGDKGGESVDTGNTSMLHTDFSQSGLSAIDADEGVDPVAEADVYMAYGRDAQAEEILLDALKADSSRTAVYLKLLEIYAQRQSPRQFESVAADLYSRTGGRGPDWEKAASLGRSLDPENPLYNAGPTAGTGVPEPKLATPAGAGQVAAAAGAAVAAGLGAGLVGGAARSEDSPKPAADSAESGETALTDDGSHELSDLDFTTSVPVEPSDSQLKDTWTMPASDMSRLDAAIDEGTPDAVSNALDAVGSEASLDQAAEDVDFSVLDFDLGGDDQAAAGLQPGAVGDNGPATELQLPELDEAEVALDLDLDVGDEAAQAVDSKSLDETISASQFDFDLAAGLTDDAAEPEALDLDLGLGDAPAQPLDQQSFDETVSASQFDFQAAPELSEDLGGAERGLDAESLKATVIGSEFDLSRSEEDLDGAFASEVVDTAKAVPGPVSDMDATVLADEYLRDAFDSENTGRSQPVIDLEATGFETSLLDFDFDLDTPESVAEASAEAPVVDLSNIDLDLDSELPEAAELSGGDAPPLSTAPAEMPSPEVIQEVDTKLDLARAYEEMGDKDGARELIDEVMKDGSPSQREAAQRLLDRLG